MATAAITAPAGRAHLALPVACIAVGALTALLVAPQSTPPTTYGATSAAVTVVGLAAGFGLLGAGAATAIVRPRGAVAAGTALLGVTWLASDWVGWVGGPALARSIAMVVVMFLLPLLLHLVLVYPSGRLASGLPVLALVVAYAAAALTGIGHALFRDPFLDLGCWSNCTDNSFLVRPDVDLVRSLDQLWLGAAIIIAALTIVAATARLARATSVARRSMWFVLAPASVAALAATLQAVLVDDRTEDPTDPTFRAAFVARSVALLAVAAGVGWGLWRIDRTRRAVTGLADELGATPPPGSLGPALARTLGDDRLTVAYWLSSAGRYVDATGRPVDPLPGRGQATTTIVRQGEPVALLIHDGALNPQAEIGAAARLAVDNERLQAEVLTQLADLQDSRTRIVSTADDTRRRLERDLHDGAQQRLLAASYELRLARSAAIAAGDAELATAVARASQQAHLAITELRDLARGIFPAILTEAGLEPALRSLAERAPLPVEIDAVVTARSAPAVETAAYLVLAATIDDASRRSAPDLAVRIADDGGHLVVEVATDANGWVPDLGVHIADRVGALGGRLVVAPGTVTAEIPCAS